MAAPEATRRRHPSPGHCRGHDQAPATSAADRVRVRLPAVARRVPGAVLSERIRHSL